MTMKKTTIIFLTALLVVSLAQTVLAETKTLFNYPHLYRGPRSLGMGGTYTAVGRDAEALFYNPATLYDMGFKLALLNPLIEVDQNVLDIAPDVQDALDLPNETDRTNELTRIVDANRGKPLHIRAALFPSVAAKSFAVGFLGQAEFDMRLHNPLSSAGAVEAFGGYEYGPVAGFSFKMGEGLRAGVGAKLISRSWVNQNFTIRELSSETFDISDYTTDNTDFSLDAGLLYSLPIFKESLKPKIGVSLLDITDLDFEEGGVIPMRANAGISVNPTIPVLGDVILAADYEDFTHEYEQDDSAWKRIHLGAEIGMLKRHLLLRAGVNQGYPTFGAELDIWLIKLAYTYYSEEMGAYAGQDKDIRQLVQLSLGWR